MDVSIEELRDPVFDDPYFKVEHKDKTKIAYLVQRPDRQYGLWQIRPQRGPAPSGLQGNFTTPALAIEKVKNYLKNK
jgi:hypothetical protein